MFGKIAADVFSRDKHLLSGVTLLISFVRSKPEFVLIHDDVAKNHKITITQANLYVRKTTVSEQVFTAIEKTLTKLQLCIGTLRFYPKLLSFRQVVAVGVRKTFSVENQFDDSLWRSLVMRLFLVHRYKSILLPKT